MATTHPFWEESLSSNVPNNLFTLNPSEEKLFNSSKSMNLPKTPENSLFEYPIWDTLSSTSHYLFTSASSSEGEEVATELNESRNSHPPLFPLKESYPQCSSMERTYYEKYEQTSGSNTITPLEQLKNKIPFNELSNLDQSFFIKPEHSQSPQQLPQDFPISTISSLFSWFSREILQLQDAIKSHKIIMDQREHLLEKRTKLLDKKISDHQFTTKEYLEMKIQALEERIRIFEKNNELLISKAFNDSMVNKFKFQDQINVKAENSLNDNSILSNQHSDINRTYESLESSFISSTSKQDLSRIVESKGTNFSNTTNTKANESPAGLLSPLQTNPSSPLELEIKTCSINIERPSSFSTTLYPHEAYTPPQSTSTSQAPGLDKEATPDLNGLPQQYTITNPLDSIKNNTKEYEISTSNPKKTVSLVDYPYSQNTLCSPNESCNQLHLYCNSSPKNSSFKSPKADHKHDRDILYRKTHKRKPSINRFSRSHLPIYLSVDISSSKPLNLIPSSSSHTFNLTYDPPPFTSNSVSPLTEFCETKTSLQNLNEFPISDTNLLKMHHHRPIIDSSKFVNKDNIIPQNIVIRKSIDQPSTQTPEFSKTKTSSHPYYSFENLNKNSNDSFQNIFGLSTYLPSSTSQQLHNDETNQSPNPRQNSSDHKPEFSDKLKKIVTKILENPLNYDV